MEDLTRLVAQSMARHGVHVSVDHRRLHWSRWERCESGFDLSSVPSKPGLLALAEELIAPGEMPFAGGKRLLAIFQICETTDLGIAMVRFFTPATPLSARLAKGHVFVRYTVIEEEAQRHSAHVSLERWLTAAAETASGIMSEPDQVSTPALAPRAGDAAQTTQGIVSFESEIDCPSPLPAGF